jgi:hypothetical protein
MHTKKSPLFPLDFSAKNDNVNIWAFHTFMNDNTTTDKPRLPDPAICETRYLGPTLDFSGCLVRDSDCCEYALRFGNSVFCRHPDRRAFEKPDPASTPKNA